MTSVGAGGWSVRADAAHAELIAKFWSPRAGLMRTGSGIGAHLRTGLRVGEWQYGQQALAAHVLLDAHERGDTASGQRAIRLFGAARRRNGGSLVAHERLDDVAWMGLAAARAHDLGLVDAVLPQALLDAVTDGALEAGVPERLGGVEASAASTALAILLALAAADWEGDLKLTGWAFRQSDWLSEQMFTSARGEVGPSRAAELGCVAGVDLRLAAMEAHDRALLLREQAQITLRAGIAALCRDRSQWADDDGALSGGIWARFAADACIAEPGSGADLAREVTRLAGLALDVSSTAGTLSVALGRVLVADAAARLERVEIGS